MVKDAIQTSLSNVNKGVCYGVALPIYDLKVSEGKKEELSKLQYFTMQKYYLQTNPLK